MSDSDATGSGPQAPIDGGDNAQQTPQQNVRASQRFGSFGIGFLAGLCAAYFPSLVAALTTMQGGPIDAELGGQIFILSQLYLILAFVFSLVIGAVATIFEWDRLRKPREVFVTALALPALLTGALGAGAGANAAADLGQTATALSRDLKLADEVIDRNLDMRVRAPVRIEEVLGRAFQPVAEDPSESGFRLIGGALAMPAVGLEMPVHDPAILPVAEAVEEPPVLLVFGDVESSDAAEQLAQDIKLQLEEMVDSKIAYKFPEFDAIKQIRILPLGERYLIISGGEPIDSREARYLADELGYWMARQVELLPLDLADSQIGLIVRVDSDIHDITGLNGGRVCVLNEATVPQLDRLFAEKAIDVEIDSGYREVRDAMLLYEKDFCQAVVGNRDLLGAWIDRLFEPDRSRLVDTEIVM